MSHLIKYYCNNPDNPYIYNKSFIKALSNNFNLDLYNVSTFHEIIFLVNKNIEYSEDLDCVVKIMIDRDDIRTIIKVINILHIDSIYFYKLLEGVNNYVNKIIDKIKKQAVGFSIKVTKKNYQLNNSIGSIFDFNNDLFKILKYWIELSLNISNSHTNNRAYLIFTKFNNIYGLTFKCPHWGRIKSYSSHISDIHSSYQNFTCNISYDQLITSLTQLTFLSIYLI
jgi:hypothetical protein